MIVQKEQKKVISVVEVLPINKKIILTDETVHISKVKINKIKLPKNSTRL